MKVMILTGSHRTKMVSYEIAEKISEELQRVCNTEIEILELANYRIDNCCVSQDCAESHKCRNDKDDFNHIYEKLSGSDGFIFIVPKYGPYPSKFMAFLERLMAVSWWGYGAKNDYTGFELYRKPSGIIGFSTYPGLSVSNFMPLFETFDELGFDNTKNEGYPGLFISLSDIDYQTKIHDYSMQFLNKYN